MIDCWSSDEENYNYTELQDIPDLEVGMTVYKGVAVHPTASSLIDVGEIIERISENAWEIAGEHSDGYPNVNKEAITVLQNMLEQWVNEYAKPHFYTVKDVIRYVVTEDDLT